MVVEVLPGEVEDGGGSFIDGGVELPGGRLHRVADLDQGGAGLANSEVIPVALDAVDDDLVLQAGEVVGQFGHLGDVVAGDAGRGGEGEAGGGAVGDVGRLIPGDLGEVAAGGGLEGEDVDEAAGRAGHGVDDGRRWERAAEAGVCRGAIDDGLDAEAGVDVHLVQALPLSVRGKQGRGAGTGIVSGSSETRNRGASAAPRFRFTVAWEVGKTGDPRSCWRS